MEFGITLGVGRPSVPRGGVENLAPRTIGALADLTLAAGTPMAPLDVRTVFAGPSLSFALAPASVPLPEGLSLSVGGILSGTAVAATGPLTVAIRASNTFGHADALLLVTVEAMLLVFDASLSGLTFNPTHGPVAQDGVAVTAVGAGFSGAPPAAITYQWKTVEGGPVAGETASSYVPDATSDDLRALYCTISAAPYPDRDTPTATIRHAPPSAAGGLMDEILDLGSGPVVIDAGVDFTGAALVFAVTGPGCTIDPATGLLTIETGSPVAGAIVTVAATNSGGTAQSAFQLTVEEEESGQGPELSVPVVDEETDSITIDVSEASTIYWRRDPLGTNPDATMVIAGGGHDSGSFPVSPGANEIDIAFAPGNDGPQEISFVAVARPGEVSVVQTVAIDIDTAPPELVPSACTPLPGATGTAVDVPVVLGFTEAIRRGTGSVTFRTVAGGSVIESVPVALCAVSGTTLAVPHAPFPAGAAVYVTFEAGVVLDLAGNPCPELSDPATLSFSTSGVRVVALSTAQGFVTALNVVAPATEPEHQIFLLFWCAASVTATTPAGFALVGQSLGGGGRIYVWRWTGPGPRPNGTAVQVALSAGQTCYARFVVVAGSGPGGTATLPSANGTSFQTPSFAVTGGSLVFQAWSLRSDVSPTITYSGATPDTTALAELPDDEGRLVGYQTVSTGGLVQTIAEPLSGTANRMTLTSGFTQVGGVFWEVLG
jgi:hypothetical protein